MDAAGAADAMVPRTAIGIFLEHILRPVRLMLRRSVRPALFHHWYSKRQTPQRLAGRIFLVDCRYPLRFAALRRQLYGHADIVPTSAESDGEDSIKTP